MVFLPKTQKPLSNNEKTPDKSKLYCKTPEQYTSKLSRSSKTRKKKKELLTILPLRVWFPEQEIIRNAESHSKEPHKQNMHFNKVIPYVQQSLVHWS